MSKSEGPGIPNFVLPGLLQLGLLHGTPISKILFGAEEGPREGIEEGPREHLEEFGEHSDELDLPGDGKLSDKPVDSLEIADKIPYIVGNMGKSEEKVFQDGGEIIFDDGTYLRMVLGHWISAGELVFAMFTAFDCEKYNSDFHHVQSCAFFSKFPQAQFVAPDPCILCLNPLLPYTTLSSHPQPKNYSKMSFSTQEKIYKANKHIRKAVMYWPLVLVQYRDQYVEMLRKEVMRQWRNLSGLIPGDRLLRGRRLLIIGGGYKWFYLILLPTCPLQQQQHGLSKKKRDFFCMTVVLLKRAKRAAPSWCSPSPPLVPGPSEPSCPWKGKDKGGGRDYQGCRGFAEEEYGGGVQAVQAGISRSKQTKKWRMSCDKCSWEKYNCVWDNDVSLGSKSQKPEVSGALVTAPDHPIRIGPPRGAHKLVYQPHRTTRTQFTIRVPPPSQAVIPEKRGWEVEGSVVAREHDV
ncbi:hypothetical protein SERLA73DRAFT_150283 [Serpula lacrymans var. lacrymans S7.3]|uniref:Uncharacterized protein n=1 Tax=Serpula lacrymans var. lacrymans (strain S7.3) TaxID=936435 RepID=F8PLW5_SERL3|nr:hypothetical protein SERLA73DRAFT_150283 [Serpula lacrymans var. lacrymans S7.3]